MFTGLVEEIGRVRTVEDTNGSRRFSFTAPRTVERLSVGDSIAVDGVCQTVVAVEDDAFAVQAIETTLSRTTFGRFEPDRRVNIEPALKAGSSIGGHLVQGHVDGVGEVSAIERNGEHVLIELHLPEIVREATILHGSIAVNGVSLTVNRIADNVAQVAIIPHTWANTTFPDLGVGDAVNLEGDMIGRYVVAYLRRSGRGA